MYWLYNLFFGDTLAHIICVLALVITVGILLGKIKIGGVSLGTTWILFVGIALGVLLGSIPLLNVPQPVKLGLAGGPLIVAILIGRFGTHFHLVTYTTMSANLMLREVGITLFLAAVGIGAGDGFVDAIVGGGYRWVGYGVIITVVPLLIVSLIARLGMKVNYYTLMGLIAGSTTDPPALAYANSTAGNDMPAVSYATVYPVVMFLRVLTAQIFILFAL